MQEMIGRVKKTSREKGYGFIMTDADVEYFFHLKNTKNKALPEVGTVVRFTPVANSVPDKRDRAVNVEVI